LYHIGGGGGGGGSSSKARLDLHFAHQAQERQATSSERTGGSAEAVHAFWSGFEATRRRAQELLGNAVGGGSGGGGSAKGDLLPRAEAEIEAAQRLLNETLSLLPPYDLRKAQGVPFPSLPPSLPPSTSSSSTSSSSSSGSAASALVGCAMVEPCVQALNELTGELTRQRALTRPKKFAFRSSSRLAPPSLNTPQAGEAEGQTHSSTGSPPPQESVSTRATADGT